MIQQLVVANAGQGMLSTILFVTVSFLVLLLALKKFAWGPVVDMMQAREDKIASDIDNAEKSKIEADKLGKQREMELKQSRTEAQGIIAQAKETAENNAHAILLEAEEHATRIKKQAHEDLRIERERMIDEAKKRSSRLICRNCF
jgi:F-type H+-transporting ATPase subunit b